MLVELEHPDHGKAECRARVTRLHLIDRQIGLASVVESFPGAADGLDEMPASQQGAMVRGLYALDLEFLRTVLQGAPAWLDEIPAEDVMALANAIVAKCSVGSDTVGKFGARLR